MKDLSIKLMVSFNNCGIGVFWLRTSFIQNLLVIPIPFVAFHFSWDVQLEEMAKLVKAMHSEEELSRSELLEKTKRIIEAQGNISNDLSEN